MKSRLLQLRLGAGVGVLAVALAVSCGGDDEGPSGGTGGSTASGGAAGDTGSGGAAGDGSGGGVTTGGSGGDGSGGSVATADIDSVVGAICDWEFKCCDRGELDYRLGPFTTDAKTCKDRFLFQLHESNVTDNPHVAGSALGLLGTLGYTVDLTRVEVDEAGVAECLAHWEALGCAVKADPVTHCSGPTDPDGDPCSLNNLFNPKLELGDACTLALTEGSFGNDVECAVGSTCLPADHPENPADTPACVKRSVQDEPCTQDADCDFNFYCGDGTCQEKGDVGDDCSFEDPDLPEPGSEEAACKVGLSCHPIDLKCVNNCSEGFTCTLDSQCPDGMSCAPLTVGDDTTSFHVCRELGDSATARCDDAADCVSTRYCGAGDVCASDKDAAEDCSDHTECPDGMYCDVVDGCKAHTARGAACDSADECDPDAAGCLWDEEDQQNECSASKRDNGAECKVHADCASGKCEIATPTDTAKTCIAGGEEDDACDNIVATGIEVSCGPGLACIDGTCTAQAGPGGNCEDPDTSASDDDLCKNDQCEDQWDALMCSDAPVPETNGGTGLTCDGS